MSQFPNRAALWLNKLAPDAPLMSGLCPSVQVADGQINGENVRFIAVACPSRQCTCCSSTC